MNDIDERLQKLEEAVWKLGRLQKLEKKIRDMRGEIEKLLSQHPELREVYETRR
jgi:vacuolar-type H+-ATPase subunit D/Vma8